MKVIVVGLGTAGCRITDALVHYDSRSKVLSCIDAIAIDRDPVTLNALKWIPPPRRFFLGTLDISPNSGNSVSSDEILAKIQSLETGDIDAIIICAGAGGSGLDLIVPVIESIRKMVIEPIFGLITLPARDEGIEREAAAARQIDTISPLFDGIILFDNEKWTERLTEKAAGKSRPATMFAKIPGLRSKARGGSQDQYRSINDSIARRMVLLFRSGEHVERPGQEIPEVVLDSGEILNTIRGSGFITVGYAADPIPRPHPLAAVSPAKKKRAPVDEAHRSAARIVDLAKYATTRDMSTSVEIGDAEKALILIAGPSRDLNMRGYLAVRRWIDRSIGGLEVRAGDYPRDGSRFVALIIILAGMAHIARLDELRAARDARSDSEPGAVQPSSFGKAPEGGASGGDSLSPDTSR